MSVTLTPKGSDLELHDVITHRAAWREALEKCRDRANPPTHDTDDPGYWRHELEVFDRTFDAVCSLISAARKGQGEWRPIESAPRDGTPILAFCVHPNARLAGEDCAEWTEIVTTRWIDFNGGGWTWKGICGVHTHWMPLPLPPPSKQEE